MTSTALLIMDVQQGIVERFAGDDDAYLERLATAIAAARTRSACASPARMSTARAVAA
jgi:nicotinamidase-related amidase